MSAPHRTAAVPPSAEVRAEALARAQRLAQGLFPHQVEGLAFLLARRRAILADDMGLGKTRQSIVAMVEATQRGPWLVVTPASVKRNWAREIAAVRPQDPIAIVGPDDPPEVGYEGWVVVNYDLLAKVDALLEDLPWTGIVFDEAHYLKNHTSGRSKHARELVAAAPTAVVHLLTGTPLTSRPRDLFPLLQLAGHPMGRSFLTFAKRYCDARHNGFGWVTDGASNLGELRAQLHGVMLRRTKDEVLDLPPKLRSWVPVAVPAGTGRAATRKVLATLIAGALERGRGRKATKTTKATAGASRRAPGGERVRLLADLTTARQQIAKAKVPTTIEFVDGVIAQGEKAIVFTSFDDPARRIAEHFGDAAVLLTGATPAHARQRLVDRFQTDDTVQVFVANLVAGGVGLNLTAARQVVFNDLDWVPANHWQAEDRAYRIGQTASVNVTYLVGEGTVEEFVATTLHAKAALVDAVVEGGADDVVVAGDVLAELERLLRTLSPDVASLADTESGEDPVDRLLREVSAAAAARDAEQGMSAEERVRRAAIRSLPDDAILALARALSGPAAVRYRATSSSKPGESYVLDVDGGDVTCGCRGFEYRGACSHSRALQAALAAGGALPPGFTREAV